VTAAEKLAVIRSTFDAFNGDDVEKWIEFFHPEGDFIPTSSDLSPPGVTYHGRVGVRTWRHGVIAQGVRLRLEPPRGFRDLGDRVLALYSVFTNRDPAPLTGATIFTFKDGKILRLESFATEAEALAAEEQENERFRFLFQHASDAVILCDDEGNFIDANVAACDLYGLSVDELRGRTIFELTPAEFVGALEELWSVFRANEKLSGESEIVSKGGKRHTVELRAKANFVPGRHLILIAWAEPSGPAERPRSRESRLFVAARRLLDERGGASVAGEAGQQDDPLLTVRELEVLQLAAEGRSTSDIAEVLYLSPGTVKTHFQHIYKKLGVHDRAAAVAECFRHGFIK
jgi:PAS domain S-box-containing protein